MSEFPKLMWAPDGREFTVQTASEQDQRTAEGFRLAVTPAAAAPFEEAAVQDDEDVATADDGPSTTKKKAKK